MSNIWLRAETKPFEKRTPLIPEHAGALVASGYQVTVESSSQRVFSDREYGKQGCKIVSENSWLNAPLDSYILGIKELPKNTLPIKHKHIYFAHVYKGQKGSNEILDRFRKGGGVLFDMEYLTDFRNEQLVTKSAGFWAGICGTAVSLLIWGQKKLGAIPPFVIPECYADFEVLINDLMNLLLKSGKPKILIIGPNGMTGSGAQSFLHKISVDYSSWSRANTLPPGPFLEILDFDILINCIMVEKGTAIFLTKNSLIKNKKLSVIGDISCDPSSPYNPLPLYDHPTTFSNPTIRIVESHENPVDIMAIDHITTLLPKEASYALSEQIFPYLCELLILKNNFKYSPWEKVIAEFYKHVEKKCK